jgi:hypothetical protein
VNRRSQTGGFLHSGVPACGPVLRAGAWLSRADPIRTIQSPGNGGIGSTGDTTAPLGREAGSAPAPPPHRRLRWVVRGERRILHSPSPSVGLTRCLPVQYLLFTTGRRGGVVRRRGGDTVPAVRRRGADQVLPRQVRSGQIRFDPAADPAGREVGPPHRTGTPVPATPRRAPAPSARTPPPRSPRTGRHHRSAR